jgi:cell division protein FtsB
LRRGARRARWLRLAVPLAVLGLVGFLYWHPISTYLETRNQLARRQQDVRELRAARAVLERRVEQSTSLEALAREARRIGLVRPGEQLFIVKGIPGWRAARAGDG